MTKRAMKDKRLAMTDTLWDITRSPTHYSADIAYNREQREQHHPRHWHKNGIPQQPINKIGIRQIGAKTISWIFLLKRTEGSIVLEQWLMIHFKVCAKLGMMLFFLSKSQITSSSSSSVLWSKSTPISAVGNLFTQYTSLQLIFHWAGSHEWLLPTLWHWMNIEHIANNFDHDFVLI